MKTVVLIFSIILSLLGILVGQFAYPFMASLFDGRPEKIAIVIGIAFVIISSIVVFVATKEKFYRRSIIIPCVINAIATFFILSVRFDGAWPYRNGYSYIDGELTENMYSELKNNIGLTIIRSATGSCWFMGIDEHGNDVLVNIERHNNVWNYKQDNEGVEKYDYKIKWYDSSGKYLDGKDFTLSFDNYDVLEPEYTFNDAKYLAEQYADINIYDELY